MSQKELIVLFVIGAVASFQVAKGEDADGDGMEDAWEVSVGLDPVNPHDAFADADGDRISNLWEFAKGTDPLSAVSIPPYDAFVDASQESNGVSRRFATLQEAYDSLPESRGKFLSVSVAPGNYAKGVDGTQVARRVAWVAAEGGEVVLKGVDSGMRLTDETIIDGFVFAAGRTRGAAVEIQPHASLGGELPEVRIVNTLINGRVTEGVAAAIMNCGGDLWLVHDTIAGNVGAEVDGVFNQAGNVHVINSIVWNSRSGKQQDLRDESQGDGIVLANSLLRGGESGWSFDPKLTMDGHLSGDSQPCLRRGVKNSGSVKDLHGVCRLLDAIDPDLGVEQWIDVDEDGLPDWWERRHFGKLDNDSTGVAREGVNLAQEFRMGLTPSGSLAESGEGSEKLVEITFPANDSVVK